MEPLKKRGACSNLLEVTQKGRGSFPRFESADGSSRWKIIHARVNNMFLNGQPLDLPTSRQIMHDSCGGDSVSCPPAVARNVSF